ncbi:hypothetical protein D018_4515A, partial [Vibrio parahaemolyticus VP2007-007]
MQQSVRLPQSLIE